jgi:pyruvate,water dikinase
VNVNNLFRHLTYRIFAPGTLVREKYEAFRQLLEHDRAANEMIAWFEELFYSRKAVDYNMLATRYERLSEEVCQMMEALFRMAPASYLNLRDYYKKIDFYIRFALAPPEIHSAPPFILMLDAPDADPEVAGGKAGNLMKIIQAAGVKTRPGFAVTTRAFNYFLEYNNLVPDINAILSEIDIYDGANLGNASEQLMEIMLAAEMPGQIEQEINDAIAGLKGRTAGIRPLRLAVRSSAALEDSSLSFAGQYKTVLDVRPEDIVSACMAVFASKYSPEAIFYRINAGLHDLETPMAVLVMEMAVSECAGVIYTADPSGRGDSHIYVAAVEGSGEKVVNGTVEPASFLVQRGAPEIFSHGGPELPCMKQETVADLAVMALAVEKLFGYPVDIEWAVDNGSSVILQARPLHVSGPSERRETTTGEVSKGQERDCDNILCQGGVCASMGQASGVVEFLANENEIDSLSKGSVVVARAAIPAFARLAGRAAAVITEYGSAASHFASVAREASLPFVAGMKDAFTALEPGMEVTVDADRCVVCKGRTRRSEPDGFSSVKREHATPFDEKLDYMLKFISQLRLAEPESGDFRPEGCRSLHDIVRFTHETGLREMFFSTCHTSSRRQGALRLASRLPMDVFILDVKDGIDMDGVSVESGVVDMSAIRSVPMQALWKGLCNPGISWSDFEHFDWKSYDSIVMAGGVASKKTSEFASYAIISSHYMNLNMRFGYHFTIVDTLCSPDEMSNYITLRFAGGGGDYHGRQLRLLFIRTILGDNGFTVRHTGDLIDARLHAGTAEHLAEKLDITGRLLGVTRLMDMTLQGMDDVKGYMEDFMRGDYGFTASMNREG